jgi:hypothetical protein
MANMKQLKLPLESPGEIFELFIKDGNREFVRHVQFIRALSLAEAEDKVAEVKPDYWKTMSVRWVEESYAWSMLEELHFALSTCKSVLDIVEF